MCDHLCREICDDLRLYFQVMALLSIEMPATDGDCVVFLG